MNAMSINDYIVGVLAVIALVCIAGAIKQIVWFANYGKRKEK
jgi:hypothetical protein